VQQFHQPTKAATGITEKLTFNTSYSLVQTLLL